MIILTIIALVVIIIVLIMALVSLRLLKLKLKLIEEKIKKPCVINCTKCRAYNRCVLNYGSDMCLIKQEPRDYNVKL